MLSQTDAEIYRELDGKRASFFLLNVDIHEHSRLLAEGDPHEVGMFYRLSSKFFELAVELNHGLVAPWQGDGGFAIFDASRGDAFLHVWNAASDFLVPYQNQVLRNLLNKVSPTSRKKWLKNYPKYYCLIDFVDFVFDFNWPGNWCGYGLSASLKNFKSMAKPNSLAITKAACTRGAPGPEFWEERNLIRPKKNEEPYYTSSLGGDFIIANPHYRDRIYKQQEDNIAGRNLLTVALIEKGFSPETLLVGALHSLAEVFQHRDDVAQNGFRASVWRKCDGHLEFVWGFPRPQDFRMAKMKGAESQFVLGEGCAGGVWKTGEPILLPDVTKSKQYCKKHGQHSDKTAAFYPILPRERARMGNYSPDDLIGVLCLGVTGGSVAGPDKFDFTFKQDDAAIIETYVTPFTLNMALALKHWGFENVTKKSLAES